MCVAEEKVKTGEMLDEELTLLLMVPIDPARMTPSGMSR